MSIGSRIQEARKRKSLTQQQLADAIGVTKGAVGNYECGSAYPKADVMYKLMAALEVDANYIYQDEMADICEFIVSHKERSIITKYRSLDAYGVRAVDSILELEYERCSANDELKVVKDYIDNQPKIETAAHKGAANDAG